mgnify:CR=1 FL=1
MLNKDGFSNYYAFKKLVKKLDNSIVLKDEWEVFEENFTQVHDEFFEILKKISASDRCLSHSVRKFLTLS